jgi:hypothetical protein
MADEPVRRSGIVGYWLAVELFSPQKIPAVSVRDRVYAVRADGPLPWEAGQALRSVPLDTGFVWQHAVYGGAYALRAVRDTLLPVFGESEEDHDGRMDGESATSEITFKIIWSVLALAGYLLSLDSMVSLADSALFLLSVFKFSASTYWPLSSGASSAPSLTSSGAGRHGRPWAACIPRTSGSPSSWSDLIAQHVGRPLPLLGTGRFCATAARFCALP